MRRLLLIGCLLCSFFPLLAQGTSSCLPRAREVPFHDGERLTLDLVYKWGVNTEVAQAQVRLDSVRYQGKSVYRTSFTVKSAPFFDIFFKMRENFQSWFTPDELKPLKFTRDTFEGNYTATNLYLYDWEQKVIHATLSFAGGAPQTLDIPLHDCVYDLPTMIFYLRAADFSQMQPGTTYPLSFAIDDAVFNIRLTYRGEEMLKVRRKDKMKVRHFSCSVVSGAMFEGNQELQFWLSADEDAIPVAVMAPLRVGSVWCWYKTYERGNRS